MTLGRAALILATAMVAAVAAAESPLAESTSTQRFLERSYEVDRARELRNQRYDEDRAIRRTLVPPAPTAPPALRSAVPTGPSGFDAFDRSEKTLIIETQRALDRLGYRPGADDGILGPRTASAIRAYQRAHGLAETGAPSAALLDRLRATTR